MSWRQNDLWRHMAYFVDRLLTFYKLLCNESESLIIPENWKFKFHDYWLSGWYYMFVHSKQIIIKFFFFRFDLQIWNVFQNRFLKKIAIFKIIVTGHIFCKQQDGFPESRICFHSNNIFMIKVSHDCKIF